MSKPVILTGLRANNDLHIGNYLGALLPLVDMAKNRAGEYQINLFVPDLHSFTTSSNPASLQAAITQNLRVFVAAGLPLDHDDVFLYRQSYISAHSELTWILDCFTGFGEMLRMTQFKDKSGSRDNVKRMEQIVIELDALVKELKEHPIKQESDIQQVRDLQIAAINKSTEFMQEHFQVIDKEGKSSVGLFNYPVMMAADILLYGAEYVPVGDDQTQHLEFTRDIAERLNKRFGELFTMPKPVKEQHEFFGKDQGLRIRDLQNPAKKMSKSDASPSGIIFLTDTPEAARKKIMSAETDSLGEIQYDYDKRPGVSNLLDILKLLGGQPAEFTGQNQYGPLKEAVAAKVSEFLTDFQSKLTAVDDATITRKLEASETAMQTVAGQRLLKVQKAVGLRA